MEISVRLFGNMNQYAPNGLPSFTMTFDAKATVSDVLKSLKIPVTVQKIILVNGRRANESTQLEDASTIVFFPPIEGG